MWFFTAPNSDRIFHAGPSTTAHWIDVTGNGQVIPAIERGNKNQMCGNAVMYVHQSTLSMAEPDIWMKKV